MVADVSSFCTSRTELPPLLFLWKVWIVDEEPHIANELLTMFPKDCVHKLQNLPFGHLVLPSMLCNKFSPWYTDTHLHEKCRYCCKFMLKVLERFLANRPLEVIETKNIRWWTAPKHFYSCLCSNTAMETFPAHIFWKLERYSYNGCKYLFSS